MSSWHFKQPIVLQSQVVDKTSQQEAVRSTTSFSWPKGSFLYGVHQPPEYIYKIQTHVGRTIPYSIFQQEAKQLYT